MSLTSKAELTGLQKVSKIVGTFLRQMRAYAAPGISTYELPEYGGAYQQAQQGGVVPGRASAKAQLSYSRRGERYDNALPGTTQAEKAGRKKIAG